MKIKITKKYLILNVIADKYDNKKFWKMIKKLYYLNLFQNLNNIFTINNNF